MNISNTSDTSTDTTQPQSPTQALPLLYRQLVTPEALAALYGADALGLAYAQLLSMGNFVHLPLGTQAGKATTAKATRKSSPPKSKP